MLTFVQQVNEMNARPPLWGTFQSTVTRALNAVLGLEKSPEQALLDAQSEVELQLQRAGFTEAWN